MEDPVIVLSRQELDTLLSTLIERDEKLLFKKDLKPTKNDVPVDLYVFSGHLEALRSEELDGMLMEAIEDLGYEAKDEDEAWEIVKAFYLPRKCTLMRVEEDEYIIGDELARRLGLLKEAP
ncbi:hypothetical protein [Deinococcus roseus]|uniref:Uncharacterized protein n=1 Tax=Deinococcus roseus TaxID=392414 RepID=A0ABQ2CUN1_9DEIO|nr:hypothetical protein [Deinococcus roseus]GGJ22490.1 hypothetical protein GCM10008938_05940 [Deinococcus roseus]